MRHDGRSGDAHPPQDASLAHTPLRVPGRAALQAHVGRALGRYWRSGAMAVQRLPIAEVVFPDSLDALKLVMVQMPDWAARSAVDGRLAVPAEACQGQADPPWDRVDWWLAAFLLLECWHERAWELRHGPIHSYSHRLRAWDARVWSHAWVNRIALFMRAWASRMAGTPDDQWLGPVPAASIALTHDVDAVNKTLAIRLKQSLFLLFNAVRLAGRGHWHSAAERIAQASAFLLRPNTWSGLLDATCSLERACGLRSRFHFYAGGRPTGVVQWLFDPSYEISEPGLARTIQSMSAQGFSIGLHLSFDAWRSAPRARAQRERLESVVGAPVLNCRQHWLRFSWCDTWAAQSQAGLAQDTTLMFNDRAGFRAAAALQWSPWDARSGAAHRLTVLPTLLMDSHLYDYQPLLREQRRQAIGQWLDELVAVGGQAAVLWHPHTLSRDYGWRDGFDELIAQMQRRSICGASAVGSAGS